MTNNTHIAPLEPHLLKELWAEHSIRSSSHPLVSEGGKAVNSQAWREYCKELVAGSMVWDADRSDFMMNHMLYEHYAFNADPSR